VSELFRAKLRKRPRIALRIVVTAIAGGQVIERRQVGRAMCRDFLSQAALGRPEQRLQLGPV
jgi:hypothetical protein